MGNNDDALLKNISECIQKGDLTQVIELTTQALENGLNPQKIIEHGLMAGMSVIGRKFSIHEVFVPEMLVAARAMNKALEILEPEMVHPSATSPLNRTFVIGTIWGDLHDIGKNLISIGFKGAGYHVVDLGIDIETDGFVKAVDEHEPDIVGISALLTTTMINIEETIEAIRKHFGQVKILVGGAPLTEKFALEIGADGYAQEPAEAVKKAKSLLS